jgi:adenylate kinase family enzyme
LIEYYKKKKLLRDIDATHGMEKTLASIVKVLESL